MESRTSVIMLCIALVFWMVDGGDKSEEYVSIGGNTYDGAGEVSEQHPVVLVGSTVNLGEVCLEVRHNGVVLVGTVTVRGDATRT